MDLPSRTSTLTYREQLRIKANCFHPSGHFVEFSKEDVEQSIPQRFELIARVHPDRLALKNSNLVYTYDALNQAANRLACLLLESSQESVAFLSDRTHGIVSILAILKAGKTYVALDPLTPVARNATYLREAGADLLVTDHEHFAAAQALAQDGQRIINVDELGPGKHSNPGIGISPDTAAGIFYTSGSTGKPKGVVQFSWTHFQRRPPGKSTETLSPRPTKHVPNWTSPTAHPVQSWKGSWRRSGVICYIWIV